MAKGFMGQQNSHLTVIVVHSTMHLMHHNHCQITVICVWRIHYVMERVDLYCICVHIHIHVQCTIRNKHIDTHTHTTITNLS